MRASPEEIRTYGFFALDNGLIWVTLVARKYRPFRIRPRITQFPSSVFTRQKTSVLHDERRKARELARDLKRIKVFYSLLISALCLKQGAIGCDPRCP